MRPALPDEFMAFISPDNMLRTGYSWKDMDLIYGLCIEYLESCFTYHKNRMAELQKRKLEEAKEA